MTAILERLAKWLDPHPYSLHQGAQFEGFYSRFSLPSGASLVLIPDVIPAAQTSSITIVYIPNRSSVGRPDPSLPPPKVSNQPIHNLELSNYPIKPHSSPTGFAFTVNDKPILSYDATSETITYDFDFPEFKLKATTESRMPWDPERPFLGPEGLLGMLPLPLHWYVHSFASAAAFELSLPGCEVPIEDQRGRCSIHEEKNWARSFPEAHHWILARKHIPPAPDAIVSLAGGRTLGLDAFIVGVRVPDKGINVDIRPPFSVSVLGFSPFLKVKRWWERRVVQVDTCDLFYRVRVEAMAKPDSFFQLGEPFPEGVRSNWLVQSLNALVKCHVYRRRWRVKKWSLWEWQLIGDETWNDGGLEFGGTYYPERG
ncbi:MAG: hypothetical protein Q9159_000659 [Coniocarpon cinnabarinum]